MTLNRVLYTLTAAAALAFAVWACVQMRLASWAG